MDPATGPEPGSTTPSWDDVVRELRRESAPPDPGGRHRGRRRSRSHGRKAAGAAAVLLAALLAVQVARSDGPEPAVDGAAAAAPESWADVVRGLDLARIRAWEAASAPALREVDVVGSPAARADHAVLAALRRGAVRPHGMRVDLDTVGVVAKEPGSVRLRVIDRRSAYELRDARHVVVRRVDARGPRAWEVRLVRSGDRWLQVSAVALGR